MTDTTKPTEVAGFFVDQEVAFLIPDHGEYSRGVVSHMRWKPANWGEDGLPMQYIVTFDLEPEK